MEKLRQLLPSCEFEVEYAWAGCFAESPVGLPYIAEPAGLPNCLAVLGSGGNGIAFAVLEQIPADLNRGDSLSAFDERVYRH